MEKKVSVNNTGIDSAGLTTDYMQAIAEYIWNGFDARATTIDINFNSNALDHIDNRSILATIHRASRYFSFNKLRHVFILTTQSYPVIG